jgi:hypothetical protein
MAGSYVRYIGGHDHRLGGTAIASGLISGSSIKKHSISGNRLKSNGDQRDQRHQRHERHPRHVGRRRADLPDQARQRE